MRKQHVNNQAPIYPAKLLNKGGIPPDIKLPGGTMTNLPITKPTFIASEVLFGY
jgi:hypothetical protein